MLEPAHNASHGSARDDLINLAPLLARLRARLPTVFAVTAAFVVGGVVYSFLVRPVYRTEAVLVANEGEALNIAGALGQLGGIAPSLGLQLPRGDSHADEALALLDSEGFLRDFIVRHDLFALLAESPYRYQLSPFGKPLPDERDLKAAVARLRGIYSVRRDRITSVITISAEWHDSATAAHLLQQLIDDANGALRTVDMTEAQRAIDVLEDEAANASIAELRQAIYKLIEMQLNRLTIAKVRSDYALRPIGPVYVPSEKERVWPRKSFIAAVSLIFGAVAGVAFAVIRPLKSKPAAP